MEELASLFPGDPEMPFSVRGESHQEVLACLPLLPEAREGKGFKSENWTLAMTLKEQMKCAPGHLPEVRVIHACQVAPWGDKQAADLLPPHPVCLPAPGL